MNKKNENMNEEIFDRYLIEDVYSWNKNRFGKFMINKLFQGVV